MNRIFVIIHFSHRSSLKIYTGKKILMNVINMGRSLAVVQALLSITVHTVERPFIAFILPMKAINVGKPLASINPLIDISPHWRKTLYM